MSKDKPKIKFKFAYDEDMQEIAVIFESGSPITPEEYIKALEAWLEYCRYSLHEMWKDRPVLETDKELN